MTGGVSESGLGGDGARISELWMDEFGKLTGQVLHGLRNGLQGVGINLEVIRSRAEHGSAAASELKTFAMNATRQFEEVSAQVEALALLSKNSPGPGNVGVTLKAIATLLNTATTKRITLEEAPFEARAGISSMAVRLILTHIVLASVANGSNVAGKVGGPEPVSVKLTTERQTMLALSDEVLGVAEALHVKVVCDSNSLIAIFPTTLLSDTVLV